MNSKTDAKIAIAILATIVFVRPSHSYLLTTMKVLLFHNVFGPLILTIVWMMNRRWTMPVNIFSSFTIY